MADFLASLASLPARSRQRTMGVRFLYSPWLELVNEKHALSSDEFGAWEKLTSTGAIDPRKLKGSGNSSRRE
jgi:hypothetical protein